MIERRYEKADENPVMARRLFLMASALAAGHVVANKMDTWFPEETPEQQSKARVNREKEAIRQNISRLLSGVSLFQAIHIVRGPMDKFEQNHPDRFRAATNIAALTDKTRDKEGKLFQFAHNELITKVDECIAQQSCTRFDADAVQYFISKYLSPDQTEQMLKDVRNYLEAKQQASLVVQVKTQSTNDERGGVR